jgi:transcriptional regulator with XRE-family HTH domain
MQQPNLGKKIAKLRKELGLTQEELVEKCNLSVRTLQRIEAGEVTPRSYTIRLIFAALGQDVYKPYPGVADWFANAAGMMRDHILKFYSYVIDLFNLKTNAMKKLTILSISFLTLFTVIFSACLSTRKTATVQSNLVGTWQLLKNGVPDTTYDNQPGQIRYKTITPGKFLVTDMKLKEGIMYAAFYGSLTVDKNTYTELIEATGGGGYARYMDGKKGLFKYSITDSLLTINGINNNYNEVWKRVR